MVISIPEGVTLPESAEFGKQYLNISNVIKPGENELFLLALKAQEVVGDEILEAREELGLGDQGRESLMRLDFVRTGNYNYFFYEHDIKRAAYVLASATVTAGAQVSGGLPIDFAITVSDRTILEPGYVVMEANTQVIYLVRRTDNETSSEITLRAVLGGTYSNVTNFPPTFTNRTTSSQITSGHKLIILGSIIQHGASTAIEFKPAAVNVRQGRVQSTYEKFGKTLQAMMVEGSNLTRTTDFDARMGQFIYDLLERTERTMLYSTGDYQTIDGGKYFFTDGLWDQVGTEIAASALDGAPTVPTLDGIDDLIERISTTGKNYVLAVGRTMRRYFSKILRATSTSYHINKSDSDTSIGGKLLEVIGTYNNVPVVYYPAMNHVTSLAQSVLALNVDNILMTTVSNQASVDMNDMNISGDGMLKMKTGLQTNEELNKYEGVILDYGFSLVHPTSHYLVTGFSGVTLS